MANNVPITEGSGASSIAAELVGTTKYQQIKVIDGTVGGTTGLIVNADGTLNARISGSVLSAGSTFNGSVSGTVGASIIGAPPANLFVGGNLVTTANPVPIQPPASGTLPVTIPGSVITVSQGSVAAVIIGGSVAVATGNSSVQVLNFPTNQNVSGSVVAFQGGTRSTSIVGQVTVVSSLAGGIFPVSGSVAAVVTNFPTTQNVSGSVAAFIIGGSIAASFTPPANQSVSGTVGASILGRPGVYVIGGDNNGTDDNSGSLWFVDGGTDEPWAAPVSNYVFNGSNWDRARGNSSIGALVSTGRSSVITTSQGSIAAVIIGGSIATSFTPPANQSVSGTVGASVIGHAPVVIVGGSIATSFNPPANQSVSGTVQTDVRSSVAVVIIGGSIATSFTPPANQSVSGTVQAVIIGGSVAVATGNSSVQLLGGSAVIGSVMTLQGTNPWIITGSVQASLTPAANQSVSGTVGASIIGTVPVTQSGTVISSISGQVTIVSSLAGGIFPISGSVAAVITNTNVNVSGSVAAFQAGARTTSVVGSVTAYQGANPWIFTGSVQGNFSVTSAMPIIILGGSIAGTYAEDATHTNGDRGLFVLGVRNDTMSSVNSADNEYSPFTVGTGGEMITANGATITRWVSGTASMLGGVPMHTSVTVIAAQGASVFTYITGVQVANLGSASVLVSFGGATSSVVGYTIAPAGGGSNIVFQNALKTSANAAFSASISGAASVYVAAQGFTARI
jgi:hypothetical protein